MNRNRTGQKLSYVISRDRSGYHEIESPNIVLLYAAQTKMKLIFTPGEQAGDSFLTLTQHPSVLGFEPNSRKSKLNQRLASHPKTFYDPVYIMEISYRHSLKQSIRISLKYE